MGLLSPAIDLEAPKKEALRNRFGDTLAELGATETDLVVLDADLACSTQTKRFADKFPDRFFNQGISEADMMCTAAGLAAVGKKPYVSTFALFAAGRAWDQVRNTICYSNLNVKIVPTHSGISLGEDGASHQSIEDLALMRTIPNMTVIVPADAVETDRIIRWSLQVPGPMYIRLVRTNHAVIHPDDFELEPYKNQVLRQGSDLTICATGEMTYHALLAAKHLSERDGIEAEVINCTFIKPFDTDTLIKSAQKTGRVLTVESHQFIGGLGGAVCEELCAHHPVPVKRLGTQDRFGQSGKPDDLFKEYGLDPDSIYAEAKAFVASCR
ncbi:MAG: transketolase family protein [Cyanobacteria bacterium HKST-UBA03]|nr:transketolase family protein [Cyanobacteria bacterium HKST-UBA03]